jgi:hypothetical protein
MLNEIKQAITDIHVEMSRIYSAWMNCKFVGISHEIAHILLSQFYKMCPLHIDDYICKSSSFKGLKIIYYAPYNCKQGRVQKDIHFLNWFTTTHIMPMSKVVNTHDTHTMIFILWKKSLVSSWPVGYQCFKYEIRFFFSEMGSEAPASASKRCTQPFISLFIGS